MVAAVILLHIGCLVILPLYLLPSNPSWGLLLVALVATSNTHWSLIHESIHHLLFSRGNARARIDANQAAGRLLSVLFGTPWRLLRFGHLLHHATSGAGSDRSEVYDPEKEPLWAATVRYYGKIFGGAFCEELVAGLLFLLPRAEVERLGTRIMQSLPEDERPMALCYARKQLFSADAIHEIRHDVAITLAIATVSLLLFGEHWWMLLAALMGRAFLVSFLDNLPHYGAPLERSEAGFNMSLCRPIAGMILNGNFHAEHHRKPSVPWYRLRDHTFKRSGAPERSFIVQALAQLKGPIPRSTLTHDDQQMGAEFENEVGPSGPRPDDVEPVS